MGLGKTLTVIALIAGTLDAMTSSVMGLNAGVGPVATETYNRTTLVVTPKSSN